MRPLAPRFECRVAGSSFVDVDTVALERAAYDAEGPLPAELVRAPDNPVDPNAVEVWTAGQKVGHVPATVAHRLAPELAAGALWSARVHVTVHPDHPDNPGLRLHLERLSSTILDGDGAACYGARAQ